MGLCFQIPQRLIEKLFQRLIIFTSSWINHARQFLALLGSQVWEGIRLVSKADVDWATPPIRMGSWSNMWYPKEAIGEGKEVNSGHALDSTVFELNFWSNNQPVDWKSTTQHHKTWMLLLTITPTQKPLEINRTKHWLPRNQRRSLKHNTTTFYTRKKTLRLSEKSRMRKCNSWLMPCIHPPPSCLLDHHHLLHQAGNSVALLCLFFCSALSLRLPGPLGENTF